MSPLTLSPGLNIATLPRAPQRGRLGGAGAFVVAAAAHALLLSGWLATRTVTPAQPMGQPISVSLIAPVATPQPQPQPQAQPKQETPKPKAKPKPIPAPSEQPSQSVAAESTPPAAPVAGTAQAEPAPVTEASFEADYLRNPAPKYPALSRRLREQGVVMLRVHVLADGNPDAVELKATSGSERLDSAAIEAVRQWRFVPAKRGDEAMAAWVVVPISFSLGV